MPQFNIPPIPPVPTVIPSGQFPHLRQLVKELDFPCAVCSAKTGAPVFRTFLDAVKEPLSAPSIAGKAPMTKMGMYATRFAIFCPECRCAPRGGPFIEGEGIIDLLNPSIPKDYKRPARPQNNVEDGGMSFDDAESLQQKLEGGAAASAVRMESSLPKAGKKKNSDLNKKSLAKRNAAKKAAKAAAPPKA